MQSRQGAKGRELQKGAQSSCAGIEVSVTGDNALAKAYSSGTRDIDARDIAGDAVPGGDADVIPTVGRSDLLPITCNEDLTNAG